MPFSVFFSMSCGCSCSIAVIQVERKFCSSGNFENYVGRVLKYRIGTKSTRAS